MNLLGSRCDSGWEKNKQTKKKNITPANYTAEVVCIDQIPEYLTESGIYFLIIFFAAQFERNLILRVNVKEKKNGEKKVEEIIVRNLLNTILFIDEHWSIRSKCRCLFYA